MTLSDYTSRVLQAQLAMAGSTVAAPCLSSMTTAIPSATTTGVYPPVTPIMPLPPTAFFPPSTSQAQEIDKLRRELEFVTRERDDLLGVLYPEEME